MVLFRQDNGLSLTQIMLLQSFFAISAVALEVPTGYFADRFGRKKSLVLSGIIMVLGQILYATGYEFTTFLLAEACFGISMALMSGADDAFIYDSLKDEGQEDQYKKVSGNATFIFLGTMACMNIAGSLIAKFGLFGLEQFTTNTLRLTVRIDVCTLSLMIPISVLLQEPKRHKIIVQKGYTKELIKTIYTTIIGQKKLGLYMVFTACISGFFGTIFRFYQPYFVLTGVDIVYIGFILAAYQIFAAISAKYAHVIEKKLGIKRSLGLIVCITGISYLLMGYIIAIRSFAFGFLQQFVRGFYKIVTTDYINHHTDSSVRATTLSIQNMLAKIVYASFLPIVGRIADIYTLYQAFLLMGMISLIIGLLFRGFLRYKKAI